MQHSSLDTLAEEEQQQKEVWELVCSFRRARVDSMQFGPGPTPRSCQSLMLTKRQASSAKHSSQRGRPGVIVKPDVCFVICADTFDYRSQKSRGPQLKTPTSLGRCLTGCLCTETIIQLRFCLFVGVGAVVACSKVGWHKYVDTTKQCMLWTTYVGLTAGSDPI